MQSLTTHRLSKKIVEVDLPRLNVQIMHEWTTPADKQIVEIIDDEEKRMRLEFFLISPHCAVRS